MAKSKPQPKVKARTASRLKAAQSKPVSDSHSRPSGALAARQNTEREGLRKTIASNAALRKLNAKTSAPAAPQARSSNPLEQIGNAIGTLAKSGRSGIVKNATTTYGRVNQIVNRR